MVRRECRLTTPRAIRATDPRQNCRTVVANRARVVATKTGVHKNCKALATIRFQEHCLRLPVRGTNLGNAVMSAVDESGNTMLRLRALNDIEVIVHPAFDATAEVRLFVAMAWGSLVEYFEIPAQGGA